MTLSILHSLVSAAYAKGSHHKLALDALMRIRSPHAEQWHRLFLKYGKLYLEGSKAPDNEFKDFKNHVLHPRDNYWGGAPAKAQSWYHNLVEALTKNDWDTAAYCAGVLSHYCVDPLHPFHTAQSEAENNIHRAAEWSIAKSYNDLRALGERHCPCITVPVSSDANWLAMLVCQGADKANAEYEKLIAHYDITRGVSDPETGFDDVGRKVVAELILYAAEMFAVILDRAFAESKIEPPEVSLTAEAFLATLNLPIKWITTRMADARERRLVEAMYDELKATGKVEKNLPEDDRVVRGLYAAEVIAHRKAPAVAQVFPFQQREKVVTRLERDTTTKQLDGPATGRRISAEIVSLQQRATAPTPRPAPPRTEAPAVRSRNASTTSRPSMNTTPDLDAATPIPDARTVATSSQSASTADRLRSKMIDVRESLTEPRSVATGAKQPALPTSNLNEIVSTTRDYIDQLRTLRGVTDDTSNEPKAAASASSATLPSLPARPTVVETPTRIAAADLPDVAALLTSETAGSSTATANNTAISSTQSASSELSTSVLEAVRLSLVTSTSTSRISSSEQLIAAHPANDASNIVSNTTKRNSDYAAHFERTISQSSSTNSLNSSANTGAAAVNSNDTTTISERADRNAADRSRVTAKHDWTDYENEIDDATNDAERSDGQGRSQRRNTRAERTPSGPRIYLTLEQDVVDAPSIGPKTAEKLYAAGIDTVEDLLKAHPMALAARLEAKSITADIITDWQDQARLVCSIPTLRGTHAQLLVGANYRSADQVAASDPEKLCADILNYAISKDGQRLLREGNPPDVEKIKSWVEHARSVQAA